MEQQDKTTFEKMVDFLDKAWICKDQIVPCLIGPVGIGKTAAVKQHAENVGAKNVVTIIASQILPSEVSGITMPDQETKSMEIYDHYRLSSLEDGDILFFDELLEADQCVLSACLTLIESRMMMSGKLLPDIQIIAATNPTVEAMNIRENIRQRFMFMEFEYDPKSTQQFIIDTIGFDPGDSVISQLEGSSRGFNILSPRSLTKVCQWIAKTPVEDVRSVGSMIDNLYKSQIGSILARQFLMKNNTPELQARRAVLKAMNDMASYESKKIILDYANNKNIKAVENDEQPVYVREAYSEEGIMEAVFNETSMDELMQLLSSLPDWNQLEKALAETEIEDVELSVNF